MDALKDYSLLTTLLPETMFTVKLPCGGIVHGNPSLNMLTISLAFNAASVKSLELPLHTLRKFS
jgi:hypothetical protein